MEKYVDCEKYYCDLETVKDKLTEYGVAIIPGILNEDERENFINGGWDYLEHISQKFPVPIKRNDEKSWKSFYKLYPLHSMLVQHWQIGHAKFNWDLRQNEKIINVFSKLWNVDNKELLTSFDGASFHFPPEKMKRGWYNKNGLHCDQTFSNNNLDCYQSWVTAYPINKGDATLELLEGSHKHHKTFAEHFNLKGNKKEWNKLTEEQQNYYINDLECKNIKISCPAGSMVIWDSRCIHCGAEPLRERPIPNFRLVSYICMTPRQKSLPANIKKRIKAFEELRTIIHIPHKIKLFAKHPRTYGGELPNITDIDKPELTPIGKSLVGY